MDLAFTNIRQVLSLHNKISPEKIFLTVISDQGREELSYGEFSARSHQTANFLQEDLQIEPGNVVAIRENRPSIAAVLFMGCWLVGAAAARFGTSVSVDNAEAYFLNYPKTHNFEFEVQTLKWYKKPVIQLGGNPSKILHFDTLVRGMPNTFFNASPEPTPDMPAYYSRSYYAADSHEIFSQGKLLDTAQALVNSQMITGNQRLISYMELGSVTYTHEVTLYTLSLFMAALLVGGSVIIDTRFYPHAQPNLIWREVAASRLHVACVSMEHIPKLTAFGRDQKALGKPIYGEGIFQQDIKQLRHIYCPDAKGQDDPIKRFTELFPFPVVTNP
jgi:hypothetical protein